MSGAVGWILWGLAALYFAAVLLPYFTAGAPGFASDKVRGRLLVGTQGLIMLAGLAVTAAFPVSKFHLVWVVPVALYVVPLTPLNPAFTLRRLASHKRKILHQLQDSEVTRDQFSRICKELGHPRPM